MTAASALQLSCQLFSAAGDGALLQTLKLEIAADRSVSLWHKWERSSSQKESEEQVKAVYHSLSTRGPLFTDSGSQFSVFAVDHTGLKMSESSDDVYPPVPPIIYFVDWGKAKLAVVSVPFTRDPLAQVNERWKCNRTDKI
jgi:hypothetical protein